VKQSSTIKKDGNKQTQKNHYTHANDDKHASTFCICQTVKTFMARNVETIFAFD